ncbi:uncharacterized protein LOC118820377 [Colossoma macropomum]|uniref:uncharacterized protein LOC118820377 n=1 Tax=Colossoma macropomum TaxID=42526 RepID=UPI00186410AA|nr:uncharacterized protein LOC118820377 [Colossoma macropomum]
MAARNVLRAARLAVTKENRLLIFVLVSLVVAEDYVGKEFHCPCKSDFRKKFFFSYLLIPAFVVFAVMYCIMRELQTSNTEPQQQESNEETQGLESIRGAPMSGRLNECSFKQMSGKWRQFIFTFWCFIPSIFWIILFFCDGRYWACYHTTFEGDADSTANAPWEWCNTNRTLTAAQKKAEKAYNDSKFGGFIALLVSTIGILILYITFDKHRREYGVSSEQTAAEQGTAEAQESSGQRTTTHTEAEGLLMAKLPATEES